MMASLSTVLFFQDESSQPGTNHANQGQTRQPETNQGNRKRSQVKKQALIRKYCIKTELYKITVLDEVTIWCALFFLDVLFEQITWKVCITQKLLAS